MATPGKWELHTSGTQIDVDAWQISEIPHTDSKSALGGASPERCRDSD